MNLISPGKLDSPAFSNSCFRAAASMGRWRGRREREGERERERGRKEKEGEKEDKSMQGESRGREGDCGRSPTGRQQSINQ